MWLVTGCKAPTVAPQVAAARLQLQKGSQIWSCLAYELETILLGSAIPSLQIWILITAQIDTSWRWIPRVMQQFHILAATSCLVAMLIPTLEQLLRLQPPWTRPVAIGWWMAYHHLSRRDRRDPVQKWSIYPEGSGSLFSHIPVSCGAWSYSKKPHHQLRPTAQRTFWQHWVRQWPLGGPGPSFHASDCWRVPQGQVKCHGSLSLADIFSIWFQMPSPRCQANLWRIKSWSGPEASSSSAPAEDRNQDRPERGEKGEGDTSLFFVTKILLYNWIHHATIFYQSHSIHLMCQYCTNLCQVWLQTVHLTGRKQSIRSCRGVFAVVCFSRC